MQNLKIATAQFEHKSGDKAYNLSVIEKLSNRAAEAGSQVHYRVYLRPQFIQKSNAGGGRIGS